MRTLTTYQGKVLASTQRSNYLRVRIRDAGGNIRDYSTLRGQNWIEEVDYGEEIDQYTATATIKLTRDIFSLSLAPLIAGSVFNVVSQYLNDGHELWIDSATIAIGQAPQSGDWNNVFHGYVDKVDWGADPLTITCRDLSGQTLVDDYAAKVIDIGTWNFGQIFIPGHFVTSSGAANGAPPFPFYECSTGGTSQGGLWASIATIVAGDYRTPTAVTPNNPPVFFKAITGGVTGAIEPIWPPYNSGTGGITDGSVVWQECAGANLWPSTGASSSPDPLPATAITDGTPYAEGGSSTLVWTARVANTWTAFKGLGGAAAAGKIITPTALLDEFFVCLQGGTAGASEPNWTTALAVGGTVTDGSIVWGFMTAPGANLVENVIQEVLSAFSTGVTLVTVPPAGAATTGLYMGDFEVQQEAVFQAIQALAIQAGYDFRYWWNTAISDFALSLLYVNRTSPTVAWTFRPGDYIDSSDCDLDITPVRNLFQCTYTDRSSQLATNWTSTTQNVAQSRQLQLSNPTSIAAYKTRLMQISEIGCAQLGDSYAVNTFLGNLNSDLGTPLLDFTVDLDYFWPVQLNDYYKFKANGRHFDSDQSLAVVSIKHTCTRDKQTTTLQLRGTPTAGQLKWHTYVGAAGQTKAPRVKARKPAAAPTLLATLGGVAATFLPPLDLGEEYDRTELHASTASSFAISPSTLQAHGKAGRLEAHGLTMGTALNACIAHRDKRGVLGIPSKTVAVTPSFVNLPHLNLLIRQNLTAIVQADYTYVSASGKGLSCSTAAAMGTAVGYDSAGLWSNTNFVWTPNQQGKYLVIGTVDLTGLLLGDSVLAEFIDPTTGGIFLAGAPTPIVTDASSGTPVNRGVATVTGVITITAAFLTAGLSLGLGFETSAGIYTGITVKAPRVNALPRYFGTQISIVQLLS